MCIDGAFLHFALQRSFRKELFNDACNRLERLPFNTLSPLTIEKFRDLADRAHKIAVQNMEKEVDYNDAPDEFKGK
mgnify:CR=1 FL=1